MKPRLSVLLVFRSLAAAAPLAAMGCAPPYAYVPWPPRAAPALGDLHDRNASIRLFYQTDRRITGSPVPFLYYGIERSAPSRGVARVSIPDGHGRGRTELPIPFFPPNPALHVALTSVEPIIDSDRFYESMREHVRRSTARQVLLFVHGYAVTFEAAAQRTAQLAHDIDFDGVAMAYSWPAQGSLLSYIADATNAEWTEPHLLDVLYQLSARSGADRIHLIAHSMGVRILSRAVREFARRRDLHDGHAFDQIILAAGDIDAEIFTRDYLGDLASVARRVSIYVSDGDWAIAWARRLHRNKRLGEPAWVDDFEVPENVDLIDATAVDHGPVGHIYYGESPTVLDDFRGLIAGESPQQRGLIARHDRRGYVIPDPRGRATRLPESGYLGASMAGASRSLSD